MLQSYEVSVISADDGAAEAAEEGALVDDGADTRVTRSDESEVLGPKEHLHRSVTQGRLQRQSLTPDGRHAV